MSSLADIEAERQRKAERAASRAERESLARQTLDDGLPRPDETPEQYTARMHAQMHQEEVLAMATNVVRILRSVEYFTLLGAQVAEGSVSKAFVDVAMLAQQARHRIDKETGVGP